MDKILNDLKAKKFAPIYFLFGPEPYFIDVITKYIDENILSEAEQSFNQVTLYGKDSNAQQVIDQCVQYPMMASHRVVILKEAQGMRDLKALAKYFDQPSPTTILVIAHKHKSLDKRTALWKAIKAKAVVFESKKLYDNQIPAYINRLVITKSRKISGQAANLLGEYLGTELTNIHNEIDKLLLSVNKGEEITLDHIQDQVGISKDFNVFELQAALGKRDYGKAFLISKYFQANAKKNPMVLTIGALYNYFSKVWIASQNANESDNILSKKLNLYNSYFLKDYKIAARNFNQKQLENVFAVLKEYDLKSKGVNNRSATENDLLPEILAKILSI